MPLRDPMAPADERAGCPLSGKGKNAAKSALEKLDLANITAREAVFEIAKILYAQHEPGKDKPLEMELSREAGLGRGAKRDWASAGGGGGAPVE